ncbi:LuxR C-terminal-related transcriptional regulator [Leifsonia sp. NPDC077715]|uniref:LuxR C-terminal-related transcriptional regulator n=1 Tax=Leifsonia sp. NPDC077715 TaxID=3155539 RepID=UPI0034498F78
MGPRSEPRDEAGAGFDLIESKLTRPPLRAGIVGRETLLERALDASSTPIVSVVAPAGYGKTTFVVQWAERDPRPFAWLAVDERDDDPKTLLSYVAEALDRVEPLPHRVFDALTSPASSVPGTIAPRLASAFAAMTVPAVLVVDDVQLLHDVEGREALAVIADNVPAGSQVVLVSRSPLPLRVGRLRAEGRLLEISAEDLTLTKDEAGRLLHAADAGFVDAQLDDVYARTEGWPVGLYLAALAHRYGGSWGGVPSGLSGDDTFVAEYIRSEFLNGVSDPQRRLLMRASVLERMSAALCEAALGLPGAAQSFQELAHSNLLLVPLDHRGDWYRFHHLFRDLLLAELTRIDPGIVPVIRRRAADWYLDRGLPEEAMPYALAGEDVQRVADLTAQLWSPVYTRGQTSTLQRWFAWLADHEGLEAQPANVLNAAFLASTLGQDAPAERLLQVVEGWLDSDSDALASPWVRALALTLEAIACPHGVERMRADADEAARLFVSMGWPLASALNLQARARVLQGDDEAADEMFAEATVVGDGREPPDVVSSSFSGRAFIAIGRHEWRAASEFSRSAESLLREVGVEDSYAVVVASATRARVMQHDGDIAGARQELTVALRRRPLLSSAIPHLAVQTRLAIVHAQLGLGDSAGARTVLEEVDDILARRPRLGTLVAEAAEARALLSGVAGPSVAGASSLTTAELRVLPMLATQLSYSEIASQLYVSKNTVRSQVYSLFRKLGATTRTEAVTRSRQLALLDG